MRNRFINTLCDLAHSHDEIFLLCGDLGYSVLEPFADQFPNRFKNVGIAEQNMTAVAAGLAREGYKVFTYSIGNFPTLRCLEQIRYDICYHQSDVKIVAVGAGYAYGAQGVSHHTTEDMTVMRSLPGMTVCSPADPLEAKALANYLTTHNGPAYVRLNKSGEANIHDPMSDICLTPGEPVPVRTGSRVAVLATGAITAHAKVEIEAANKDWALFSFPFVGDYNPAILKDLANQFEYFITIEEHQRAGGFGASIIEAFSDLYVDTIIAHMPKIKRIAISDEFLSMCGSQEYLRAAAGLSLSSLFDKV